MSEQESQDTQKIIQSNKGEPNIEKKIASTEQKIDLYVALNNRLKRDRPSGSLVREADLTEGDDAYVVNNRFADPIEQYRPGLFNINRIKGEGLDM